MTELLSPAGSPEALRAAVQSGADAVYLGLGSFNARRSARNFSEADFAAALRYCHERGVRVFLTLNTLLSDRELPQALETARLASRLGADAVLVQDWGLFALLRQALPDLPLHASTQMSLFTSGGACEAARLGCERVVIARECSARDTERICRNCPAEVEIFAHGALCMCYSGQCYLSALIGGRSGSRGACAQPCRLPYGLNGPARGGHPLSLKDNCLAGELQTAEAMGVACLKLEGRMKRAEYVAVVTGIYARLLQEHRRPTPEEAKALEAAFSRQGFTDAYWQGRRGPKMFGSRPENAPEPKDLFARARAACEKDSARAVPVDFSCAVTAGVPCVLTVSDADGHTVTVTGPVPEAARTRPLTGEELEARLRKTGGTAYCCQRAAVQAEDGLSLSASAVNELRRRALAALTEARCAVPRRRELPYEKTVSDTGRYAGAPELTVTLSSRQQLSRELLVLSPAAVALPLETIAEMGRLPDFSGEWQAILPRVWRDRDEETLRALLETARENGVTALLLGNLGHFPLVRGLDFTLRGDYGLNAFNSRSLAFLKEEGLASACLSFELKGAQIRSLRLPLPAEAIVYGRLPLMITENCLVQNGRGCRLDVQGPAVPDQAPCRESRVLTDRTGASFPILGVWGHRSELQNSLPLWLADREDWKRMGLRTARLRFTTEPPEEVCTVLRAYQTGAQPPAKFTRGLWDRGVE